MELTFWEVTLDIENSSFTESGDALRKWTLGVNSIHRRAISSVAKSYRPNPSSSGDSPRGFSEITPFFSLKSELDITIIKGAQTMKCKL